LTETRPPGGTEPAPVPIIAFDEIDSTLAEARRRVDAGEDGPLWIIAASQSAGRGRRGRGWESSRGNLFATLLMLTGRPPAEAAQISFVAALAAADLAELYLPAELIGLKWPNDLMIGGRKACGILVESGRRADGALWLATGIGVNLAHPPVAPEWPATAFVEYMTTPPPSPREALDGLAAAFAKWLRIWDAEGFAPIAAAWTRRAHGLGGPCTARLGSETVVGLAEGLDPDGALRLRLADGAIRRITAGDVFFGDLS
jgi:BirA family transcriptional regulator, biotin operon repressor / biotin---[acetyl-CoA-carboxylase] ligase